MSTPREASRERPILFSGPMVRAILEGRKTQTRRVVTPQPELMGLDSEEPGGLVRRDYWCMYPDSPDAKKRTCWQPGEDAHWSHCPYGQPGDRLWVKETFFDHGPFDPAHPELTKREERIEYREEPWDRKGDPAEAGGWTPSTRMKREQSRLTLEITEVRVERVQDITANDCIAEGIPSRAIDRDGPCIASALMYIEDFKDVWNELNESRGYGWDANPWVWCIAFRKVTP